VPETFTRTGTQLATEVKNQFGDVGSVQINDAMILNWINNGAREITASNPWNEQVFDTNLIAEQQTYDLNALMNADRVQNYSSITVGGNLVEVIPWAQWLNQVAAATPRAGEDRTPSIAAEYGGRLALWPTPGESVVGGLTIYYTAWPTPMVALTEALPVPDRFYNALVAYVNARALELDENFEAAQVLQQQHKDAVAMELQRDTMDPTAYYPAITYDDRW
jgi:hypothetical protein